MAITIVFLNGEERVFPEAARMMRRGGVLVLTRNDGSEIAVIDVDEIERVAAPGTAVSRLH